MQDFDTQAQLRLDTIVHPEKIHPTAFVAQGAVVVGDVTLGEDVGVWFNSTLRGDVEAVVIGPRTNIQEGCILHADPGYPCVIGEGLLSATARWYTARGSATTASSASAPCCSTGPRWGRTRSSACVRC